MSQKLNQARLNESHATNVCFPICVPIVGLCDAWKKVQVFRFAPPIDTRCFHLTTALFVKLQRVWHGDDVHVGLERKFSHIAYPLPVVLRPDISPCVRRGGIFDTSTNNRQVVVSVQLALGNFHPSLLRTAVK